MHTALHRQIEALKRVQKANADTAKLIFSDGFFSILKVLNIEKKICKVLLRLFPTFSSQCVTKQPNQPKWSITKLEIAILIC